LLTPSIAGDGDAAGAEAEVGGAGAEAACLVTACSLDNRANSWVATVRQ